MKRVAIALVLLLMFSLVVWLWLDRHRGLEMQEPENSEAAKVENREGRSGESQRDPELRVIADRMGREFSEEEKELKPPQMGWNAWAQFIDMFQQDSFMNGPIEFYGRVVTPDGDPVPAVTLAAEIKFHFESIAEKMSGSASGGKKKIDLVTDQDGRFSVQGEKGFGLQVFDFEKDGFILTGEKKYWGGSFNPNVPHRHVPDPKEPVEFVMQETEE